MNNIDIMEKVNKKKLAKGRKSLAFVVAMSNVLGYVIEDSLTHASHANKCLLHQSTVPKESI